MYLLTFVVFCYLVKTLDSWLTPTEEQEFDLVAIECCIETLEHWGKQHQKRIFQDHNLSHFYAVMNHAYFALLARKKCLSQKKATCILLASLLHDVDDRKIWQRMGNPRGFPEATLIMKESKCNAYIPLTLNLISLVSASQNGNRNDLPPRDRWRFIPREADRIEALGLIGIKRLLVGAERNGIPLCLPSTPIPRTIKEIQEVLQQRPFELYLQSGGACLSVFDHYYDKLFHLNVVHSKNPYLQQQMDNAMKVSTIWVLMMNRRFHIYRELNATTDI